MFWEWNKFRHFMRQQLDEKFDSSAMKGVAFVINE